MKTNKITKINEAINKYGHTLNLHQIKAITGAGNGYTTVAISTSNYVNNNSKLEKIYSAIENIKGKVNLHQIKALTGAGNGYRH